MLLIVLITRFARIGGSGTAALCDFAIAYSTPRLPGELQIRMQFHVGWWVTIILAIFLIRLS